MRLISSNEQTLQNKESEQQFEARGREHELLLHKVCQMYAYTDVDRQDLFQDMVVQLWQAYPNFKGNAKFSTWLYRVAINTAITGRRKQRDFVSYHEPASLPPSTSEEPEDQLKEERLQQLNAALVHLDEIEKAIVMLYLEERSYEEMEEVLGIKEGTLRVKMSRIKEKLRQLTNTASYGTR